MGHVFYFITNLGDSTLLVPASALLAFYLFWLGAGRTAKIWLLTLALCAVLTLSFKVCFLACGPRVPFLNMESPSGHTSMSMTFYGCCALMLGSGKERRWQLILLVAGLALAGTIALSRVILHMHTATEVLAGLLIGAVCVGWFGDRYRGLRPHSLPWAPMLATMLVLALVLHGVHWDIEGVVRDMARLFQTNVRVCA